MGVREMLLSRTLDQMDSSNSNGKRKVYVFRASPGCCPRCQAMNGKVISSAQASLYSHPHCKCSAVIEYK